MEGKTNIFCETARTCFSKYKEINSETLETSTQSFGIKRTLSKKVIRNILQTPENFVGNYMAIKTTEERTRNHQQR